MDSVESIPAAAPARTASNSALYKVVVSSTIGNIVEWYDFFIFASASLLAFDKVFYPNMTPLVGTMVALTTYAVGFIARPLGGLICGQWADRKGRKSVLVLTLLVSGFATFAVGLLPGYATIGIWGAVALVVVRILHGFSMGGEQANAILIACEHAPAERRGFFGAWIQLGAPLGYVIPLGLFALLTSVMSNEAFLSWGWRVPFLLAGLLIGLGLYIRLRITESPAFLAARERKSVLRTPLRDVIRLNGRELALGTGMRLGEGATFTAGTVLIVAYAVNHGVPKPIMTECVLIALLLEAVMLPVQGMLSDRFGRRTMYGFGGLVSLVAVPLAFYGAMIGDVRLLVLGLMLLLGFGHAAMYGTQPAYLSELFPVERRASGMAFVQTMGSLIGTAPALLAGWLLNIGNGTPWYLVAYLLFTVFATLFSVRYLPETAPRYQARAPRPSFAAAP